MSSVSIADEKVPKSAAPRRATLRRRFRAAAAARNRAVLSTDHGVRVDAQLLAPPDAQTVEVHPQALASSELEGRDHSGVPRDDCDVGDEAFERKRSEKNRCLAVSSG